MSSRQQIAVQTELVELASLVEYPGNARRGNIPLVRESLRTHGQYRPIVAQVGTRYILAGNHTAKAAIEEGWSHLLVTWVEVDEEQARRINLVDNRSNDEATYDFEALDELLASLDGNYSGTGFDAQSHAEVKAMLGPAGFGAREKDIPGDVPAEPTTKLGDRIELGPHLLVCGDCTADETWDLIGPVVVPLVVTDPPYIVSYDGVNEHGQPRRRGESAVVPNDALSDTQADDLIYGAFQRIERVLSHGGVFYSFAPPGPDLERFHRAMAATKMKHSQTLIWLKDRFVFGRSDYHYRHEAVLYGWRTGGAHHAVEDRTQDSVLEFPNLRISKDHPTMKPVAMLERMIENSSNAGDLVLDPFAGSGSTLVAAAATGRRALLIEVSPHYCDSIIDRWNKLTGG